MRLLIVTGFVLAAALLPAGDRAPLGQARPFTRVELTASAPVEHVVAFIEALGGEIEVRSGQRLQARLPESGLAALQRASALVRVERQAFMQPLELSAAAALIGADRWQAAGFTGRGVRVAVIDTGFSGYEDAFAESAGPPVRARSFRSDGSLDGGGDHGRQAAAIVREMAPGAELYLLSFSTVTELSAAVDYAVAERVDVVSFSVGFIHNGPGDGTGAVNEIVDRAVAQGVIWAVAAGNWAEQHWRGPFEDTDGDLVHEFAPGEELNGRDYRAGDLITASLRWDDAWGAACSDYDLELFGPDGSLVQASRAVQNCSGDPVEGLRVLATSDGRYSARVVAASTAESRTLDLLMLGSPDRGAPLDDFVRAGSLSEPADHPSVVTVGALASNGGLALAGFSSRGPTGDGRDKPELVSPTGLAASEAGLAQASIQFSGTSAAAPYVAGAIGLLLEGLPELDPSQIIASLQTRSLRLPGEPEGTAALTQLGTLEALGPLVPDGGGQAELAGALPSAGGLAKVVYRGPDAYPLRFIHRLTGDPTPVAFFRYLAGEQRWDRHLVGAPAHVNTFDSFNDGDVLVLKFAVAASED